MSRESRNEQLFDEMSAFNRKLRAFFDAAVREEGLTLARARALVGDPAILLADDLSRLLGARVLAMRTRKIIIENFSWSIGYNLLVLPLAASGWLPPYLAAAGMSLSSLIVVTNSMRLNR